MLKHITHIKDVLQGKTAAGVKRSSRWPEVRKEHLAKNPTCALCDGKQTLEVHHVRPFHLHPELELDPENLITLCEAKKGGVTCHQFFGHLGNYKFVNESVREDVATFRAKIAAAREALHGRAEAEEA